MKPTMYTSRPRDSYPARLLRALLSAIIPGLGQLAAGVRRRAFILFAIFVVVTLAAVIIVTRSRDSIVAWVIQPRVLLGLLWVDIIVMLIRVFAVVDAWMTAKAGALKPPRPSASKFLATGVGLVIILVFTVAPHVVAGYYTLVSHNLLTTVFAGKEQTTTTSVVSTTGSSGGTSGSTSGSQTTQNGSSTSLASTSVASTSTTLGSNDRITMLLIGSDAGYGRTGGRADSMNVATINLKTGDVAIFGLPRNTGNAPLGPKTSKALGMTTWDDLLNALYTAGSKHPEIAPDGGDPGAEAVEETASIMLGIHIDYYAVVDMMGLADMVDALGGIEINLKTALHITYAPLDEDEGKQTYVFNVGINHLDGLQALAFARDRSDSNDYVRMSRQRCVLMAMLYQNSMSTLLLRFPKIAAAIEANVKTNVPLSALSELIKLRSKVQTNDMIAVGFTPPDYLSNYTGAEGTNVLDLQKVQAAVKTIVNDPQQWIAEHPSVTSAGGASDCWKITD